VSRSTALHIGYLALAGVAAADVGVLMHEVVGHGVVALAFGSRIHYFFVSPLFGTVSTWSDPLLGAPFLMVGLAGPLSNAVVGAVAWWRARAATTVAAGGALWCAAAFNVLIALVYGGIQPLLESLTGRPEGDVARVLGELGIPAAPVAIAATALGTPVVAALMRDVRAYARATVAPRATAFTAVWILLAPSVLAITAYYAATFAEQEAIVRVAWPFGVASVFALTVFAALVLRVGRGAPVAAPAPRRSPTALAAWAVASALVVTGTFAAFGPTFAGARGIYAAAPDPRVRDVFVYSSAPVDVRVTLSPPAAMRIAVTLTPHASAPLAARLVEDMIANGPSDGVIARAIGWAVEAVGALDEAQFGAEALRMIDPAIERVGPRTWVATTTTGARVPGELTLRPASFMPQFVGSLEIAGPGLEVITTEPSGVVAVRDSRIVWSGPVAPRALTLRWRP
jgi:hypothetical protein